MAVEAQRVQLEGVRGNLLPVVLQILPATLLLGVTLFLLAVLLGSPLLLGVLDPAGDVLVPGTQRVLLLLLAA